MRQLAVVFLLLAGGCREFSEPRFDDWIEPPQELSLAELREYLHGEGQTTVTEDVTIQGRVVSSDRDGNFYNTFFIDDGTGAAEIMAGISDLNTIYRLGQQVVVRLRGLATGWRDGALQIGLPPELGSRYATGYFYNRTVIENWVTAERYIERVMPTRLTVSELSREFCGRPVRISGLTALDSGTWAKTSPAVEIGYVRFSTQHSDTQYITVVTSGYASWAYEKIPAGAITLTGLLFYGRGGGETDHFLLKLRYAEDIDY